MAQPVAARWDAARPGEPRAVDSWAALSALTAARCARTSSGRVGNLGRDEPADPVLVIGSVESPGVTPYLHRRQSRG
ncbi:hypothetical protein BN10_1250003 [Phycicoccus elongatus Lp2]|uniref:Uncharacterized protein n=1 Tax=Phycicoccus elongatus Lp2 TaxID=1193181 RepID=N0DZV3_9MICO|nr:hypothetical protein BN10_1250003 [Phycicoccus elongatus Lp2]